MEKLNRLRINLPVRLKNPWFWVGLAGVICTAMGADPAALTSWAILADQLRELVSNPYMLASVAVAILGVFVDPTTKGVGDSAQALRYKRPRAHTNRIPIHLDAAQLQAFSASALRRLAVDMGLHPSPSATQAEMIAMIGKVDVYVPEGVDLDEKANES